MSTNTRGRLLVTTWYVLAGLISAAVAATILSVSAGAANGVPYDDPLSVGSIALYDKDGKAVTGGKVQDKPFVWRAVSSQQAPAPYDKEGRKATLLAYQPRKGASPTEWSGDTLTASTTYTDAKRPTAQATAQDFSLQDYMVAFPPRWDGLLQLRLYFSAPEEPVLTSKYVTTDIRVSGDSWAIVRSGPKAGAAPAAAGGAGPGAVAGGQVAGGGTVAGSESNTASAILPNVGTPGILIIGASGVVGVVLLGLIRRRRFGPDEIAVAAPVAASVGGPSR